MITVLYHNELRELIDLVKYNYHHEAVSWLLVQGYLPTEENPDLFKTLNGYAEIWRTGEEK